jgi:hypothetical protein
MGIDRWIALVIMVATGWCETDLIWAVVCVMKSVIFVRWMFVKRICEVVWDVAVRRGFHWIFSVRILYLSLSRENVHC